jgi:hypothetical protein
VRNALHAEVDTWNSSSEASASASVDQLWKEIFAREPGSRNPNALVLSQDHLAATEQPTGFISIHQLTGTTGG